MMSEYEIVPATLLHAAQMAPNMRQPDVDEVWASSHYSPEDALCSSIGNSVDAWTMLFNGQVLCIGGVGQMSLVSNWGAPWLLGVDDIKNHTRAFLRESKAYTDKIRQKYPLLLNFADARNTIALRWLKWLGFEIEPAQPFGIENMPFHRFTMETN